MFLLAAAFGMNAQEKENQKEVGIQFNDKFGARPDVLNNPNDILELAKQRATSFHSSEELWSNPLQLSSNFKKHEIRILNCLTYF